MGCCYTQIYLRFFKERLLTEACSWKNKSLSSSYSLNDRIYSHFLLAQITFLVNILLVTVLLDLQSGNLGAVYGYQILFGTQWFNCLFLCFDSLAETSSLQFPSYPMHIRFSLRIYFNCLPQAGTKVLIIFFWAR